MSGALMALGLWFYGCIVVIREPNNFGVMKPIILTFHAAVDRMAKLNLELEWVEAIVRTPDWTSPDPKRLSVDLRYKVVPELGGRVLRVVCVEEDDHIRVISVFPDRNAKRRHDRQNQP